MFRPMRRSRQQLPVEEAEAILKRNTSGVLAVAGDEGYPYAVPLSYLYDGGRLIFHSAKEGHKLDAIRRCGKASFCVIDRDDVVPEEYTTYFASVIAFGTVREIDDPTEMRRAAMALGARYAPDADEKNTAEEVDSSFDRLCMLAMTVEHMTGKEAIELTRRR